MSDNQQESIKYYLSLLVHQFILDPRHKNYYLVFKDDLGKSEDGKKTAGRTIRHCVGPDYELIQFPRDPHKINYRYEIQFKNSYHDHDELREVVVHEFTHYYLFSTIGNHEHDDNFYSWMEYFENWLDKNQNLTPRKDKSQDRNQHVNNDGEVDKNKDQILTDQAQFTQLIFTIMFSPDLETLEKNYRNIIQNHYLYDGNKNTFPACQNDNKTELDSYYSSMKEFWQLKKEVQQLKQKKESELWLYLSLMGLVIILGSLIWWWLSKKKKNNP